MPVNGPAHVTIAVDPVVALAAEIAACTICRDHPRRSPLPHGSRPIFQMSSRARVVIASQAPGLRAHTSGVPFDDASGHRLRQWMGIGPEVFYDADRIAIVPMGFCFPGYDAQKGDLPPRPECRPAWHDRVFARLPQAELILTIGIHSMRYHFDRLGRGGRPEDGMTARVAAWRDHDTGQMPRLIPLPHPSWRNSAWLNRNPWFEAEVLPVVRAEVQRLAG